MTPSSQNHLRKIAFIGGGNMARSLITGLIANGHSRDAVSVVDRHPEKCAAFQNDFLIQASPNMDLILPPCDLWILAIKPQDYATLFQAFTELLKRHQPTLVSLAVGLTVDKISSWAPDLLHLKKSIVRAMPNTPAFIGYGATGLYAPLGLDEHCKTSIDHIFQTVGCTAWVESESDLDTVTALSGSGPAYIFYILECLIEHAVEMGLSKSVATNLAIQTVRGASELAFRSEKPLAQLRQEVTSKGGTTEQGLKKLELGGISDLLKSALWAAKERAQRLGD